MILNTYIFIGLSVGNTISASVNTILRGSMVLRAPTEAILYAALAKMREGMYYRASEGAIESEVTKPINEFYDKI